VKRRFRLVAALLCIAASPVKVQHNSKALEFSYQWSAEAAVIPSLDRRFRAQMAKDLQQARNDAAEDQKAARENRFDFHQNFFSAKWTTAGQSPRLLSLQSETDSYAGGAHPNSSYDSLLWDRQSNKPITMESIFVRAGDFAKLTRAAYCQALDAERLKRRDGDKPDLADFNACPKYSDLAIAPVDRDHNGRFDRIAFVASPYVAGPYVEGEYDISIPVTERIMAALKREYRTSFEPQRQ
jgi:hypothetical protein